MKLSELIGENGEWAKEAIAYLHMPIDDRLDEVQKMTQEERANLTKGLCSIIALVANRLTGGSKPMKLFRGLQLAIEQAAELDGKDMSIHREVLGLFEAMFEGPASVFYLRLHSVDHLATTALSISTLFDTIAHDIAADPDVMLDALYDQVEHLI